jgi:plastocyanin
MTDLFRSPRALPRLTALLALIPALAVGAEFSCQVTAAKGGDAVREAAVSLIPLEHAAPPVAEGAHFDVAQEGQEFFPYVSVVQNGTRVVFPNRDTVQHHVYSLSKAKKFELPLYNPGQKESLVFETAGEVVVGCNIHDWMIAYVVIVPTPWYGKTDAGGRVTITAPAGRYRVEVWHPRLAKTVSEELTLGDGAPTHRDFSLTLKPDRRVRRGGAGKSGGYR